MMPLNLCTSWPSLAVITWNKTTLFHSCRYWLHHAQGEGLDLAVWDGKIPLTQAGLLESPVGLYVAKDKAYHALEWCAKERFQSHKIVLGTFLSLNTDVICFVRMGKWIIQSVLASTLSVLSFCALIPPDKLLLPPHTWYISMQAAVPAPLQTTVGIPAQMPCGTRFLICIVPFGKSPLTALMNEGCIAAE